MWARHGGGRQTRFRPKQVSQVLETYLNYTTPHPVGPGTLDLTGGYSWSKNHAEFLRTMRRPASPPTAVGNDGIVPAANVKDIWFEQESKLVSFFGRANYNINDRYLARLQHTS